MRRALYLPLPIVSVLLFGMLVINLVLPPEALLFGNVALRYLVASFLTFAPVFLANVIFSNSFRESETADAAAKLESWLSKPCAAVLCGGRWTPAPGPLADGTQNCSRPVFRGVKPSRSRRLTVIGIRRRIRFASS